MTTITTNRITTIKFLQYGDIKTLEYRGEMKEALSILKYGFGIKTVISGSSITGNSFMTKGLARLLD